MLEQKSLYLNIKYLTMSHFGNLLYFNLFINSPKRVAQRLWLYCLCVLNRILFKSPCWHFQRITLSGCEVVDSLVSNVYIARSRPPRRTNRTKDSRFRHLMLNVYLHRAHVRNNKQTNGLFKSGRRLCFFCALLIVSITGAPDYTKIINPFIWF